MKNLLMLSTLLGSFASFAAPVSVAIDYTLKSSGAEGSTRSDAVKTELQLEAGRWTPVGGTGGSAQRTGSLVRLVKSDEKTFELEFLFLESTSNTPIVVQTTPHMIGRYGLPMNITTKTAKGDVDLSLTIQVKKAL